MPQEESKLHGLVAVEPDRKKKAKRFEIETNNTFAKKPTHFVGHIRKYEPIIEGGETFDGEESHIVTSVPEKLKHFEKAQISMLDVILQKEKSNTKAGADIIIKEDDVPDIIVATAVPVQALIQFENHLTAIRDTVYSFIPTLDPKNNWFADETRGKGYYKTGETKKRKTNKEQSFTVVVQPTEFHPADVRPITKDVHVGNWIESSFSGMMSPADKSNILDRIGKLIEAVKRARAKANQINAEKGKVASKFFKYINEGTV